MRAAASRTTVALVTAVLLAAGLRAGLAEEPARRRMTWEGYLFRDAEGRTRLGWHVIAMGVMAMSVHEVAKPDAERLAPLVGGVADDYVFWNYELEKADDAVLRRLPRHLVRIEGDVAFPAGDEGDGLYSGERGPRTMSSVRLLAVEVLPEAWLRAWAGAFRAGMPFRIDVDASALSREEAKTRATQALAVLKALRAVPGPTAAEREAISRIEPTARVVDTYRRQTEWEIQRWIVETNERRALGIEGIADLGRLPPSGAEVNRWFLESKSKAEFLARVRAAWDGPLAVLRIGYYETGPNWASLRSVDLQQVEDAWDDATWVRHRDATTKTLGR